MMSVKPLYIAILLGMLCASPFHALAKVQLFACEPEWEALAKEIGREYIQVKTATTAFMDPHHIRAKPSLIAAIRRSDMVLCSGNDLEVGWLPILLERGKAGIQVGEVGYLMASDHVPGLEVPHIIDRSHGDIHPGGNPHVHLNPYNILKVADELAKRLAMIDPDHAIYYQKHFQSFQLAWHQAIERWEQKAAVLKGMHIVVHHKNWTYLEDWLGLVRLAALEPKPGIPPTFSHLEAVLKQTRGKGNYVIIRAPFEVSEASEWLAKKSGGKAIELPFTVGGNAQSDTLFGLFESIIALLLEARQ